MFGTVPRSRQACRPNGKPTNAKPSARRDEGVRLSRFVALDARWTPQAFDDLPAAQAPPRPRPFGGPRFDVVRGFEERHERRADDGRCSGFFSRSIIRIADSVSVRVVPTARPARRARPSDAAWPLR